MKPHDKKIQKVKQVLLIILTALLVVLLILLAVLKFSENRVPEELQTQTEQTEPPTEIQTQPTETEAATEPPVTETDPPETQPPETEAPPTETSPPAVIKPKPSAPKPTQPPIEEDEIASGDITCEDFALFSGQYVEDGRDELVTNVAAILVKNKSDRFLDFATLSFDIDGKTATFIVTGLPAGRSAWVMEATRMTATHDSTFTYLECVSSFRDDVIVKTDKVTITADGNMLTAANNSQQTMNNVCVYYRTVHSDGNFFGGITYVVDFGTLEPGQSAETLAGHYDGSKTEIVRISWQTG